MGHEKPFCLFGIFYEFLFLHFQLLVSSQVGDRVGHPPVGHSAIRDPHLLSVYHVLEKEDARNASDPNKTRETMCNNQVPAPFVVVQHPRQTQFKYSWPARTGLKMLNFVFAAHDNFVNGRAAAWYVVVRYSFGFGAVPQLHFQGPAISQLQPLQPRPLPLLPRPPPPPQRVCQGALLSGSDFCVPRLPSSLPWSWSLPRQIPPLVQWRSMPAGEHNSVRRHITDNLWAITANGQVPTLGSVLALPLPRVINVKFPLQPQQKYYTTQYGELGFS